MKKRIISLLLAIMMLVGMLPTTAFATEAVETSSEAPTEPEKACTCESEEEGNHAPFCALYTAPQNPECFCVEPCTEGATNEWCDICYFDAAACASSGEEAAVFAQTYIASIAVAYGAKENTPKDILRDQGYTIIEQDLNKNCGASTHYIYMGYKTTTDYNKAITGIFIRDGSNPPDSATFDGVTAYLLGGSGEPNPGENVPVDLNADAGGAYLYTYVTRDARRAPITEITFSSSNSKSGYTTANENLNKGAGGDNIYLHYKQFSANVTATYWYIDDNGNRQKYVMNKTITRPDQTVDLDQTDFANEFNYNGKKFVSYVCFGLDRIWRDDDQAILENSGTTSVSLDTSGKVMRQVYVTDNVIIYTPSMEILGFEGPIGLTYDTNGGKGTFERQNAHQPINAGASSIVLGDAEFTLHSHEPTHTGKCAFLGWSTNKDATTASYQPGETIGVKDTTVLYAIWKDHDNTKTDFAYKNESQHTYKRGCCGETVTENHTGTDDGICDLCGNSTDAPSQSGGVYQITNKDELIWFMQHVNRGNKSASAEVMNNIDMGGAAWSPIAQTGLFYKTTSYDDNGYTGTFDGNNKVISNFKITTSTTVEQTYGLFGTVSGTVKNLGVTGVTYTFPSGTKDLRAGGIVGQMLPGSRVENCYVTNSTITPGQYIVGGIAACNYGGTIENCYTYNVSTSGHERCGNLVSDTRGDINTTDRPGAVINCWTDAGRVAGTQSGGLLTDCQANVSDARFASGEVAWALGEAFGQTIGTQNLPVLGGAKVNYGFTTCDKAQTQKIYTNEAVFNTKPVHDPGEDNICDICDVNIVVKVTIGGVDTYYETLDAAIQTVSSAAAEENAVVKLLQDVNLGDSYQTITSGVFTLDLNGFTLSSTNADFGTVYINGADANVTIADSGETGAITGNAASVEVDSGTVTISGGTFHGVVENRGIITGGAFNGTVKNFGEIRGDATLNCLVENHGTIRNSKLLNLQLGENFQLSSDSTGTIICESHFWKDGFCRLCSEACTHQGHSQTGCDLCGLTEDIHSYDETTHSCDCGLVEEFTVIFKDRSSDEELGRITAPYGSDISAKVAEMVDVVNQQDPGCTFYCWVDSTSRDEVQLTTMPGKNMTVVPVVTFLDFDIFYYADGELYYTAQASYTNGYQSKEPKTAPTREGYSFAGWIYYSSYDAQTGVFSDEYTKEYAMPNHPLYANAQWDCLHGKLEYEDNGDWATHDAVCGSCGKVMETALPHEPSAATFQWPESAGDPAYVRVNCICGFEMDSDYADAELTESNESADCSNPGSVTYTATAEFDGETYRDTKTYTVLSDNHIAMDANGFCSCGGYQAAYYNEESGVYEISNAGQLYWYAQYLNTENAEIYAKLTKDIVIPENAPNWEPINSSYAFFDGNFKTISGLKCVGGDAQYVGLFGHEGWWYEISNLHITDSYFEGSAYVGAVVAELSNGGSVTNCHVTNTTVTGNGSGIGSLVGALNQGNVINSYTDSDTLVGYRNSNYGNIENSYYLSAEQTEDGGKTAAQFASGEVAFLLQAGQQPGYDYDENGNEIEVPAAEVWGQKIGVDAFPTLGGQKVNYGYVACGEAAEKVYTNAAAFSEKPDHSGEIAYTPNADGTTHSGVYSCCGDTAIEKEAHTQPVTWINQGEAGHISYYACCQTAEDVATVPHSYDEATLLCGCGEVSPNAVALVSKDGTPVKAYTDLQTAAIDAKAYTAEDKAVLKLLKNVDLGDENVELRGGVYTLNLNGFTITSTKNSQGAVYIDGASELTIRNGTIVGYNSCIQFVESKLTLIDVVLLEASTCIYVYSGEVIMRRCDIQTFGGIRAYDGSVAVYDSTIVSEDYDVDWQGGTVTFYGGTEFPGGIETSGVNLEALLGEGMAYWQGDKQMFITADQTEITGGDVTVKAACTHENYTITYTPKDSDSHCITYSCCGMEYEEVHSFDEYGNCTICGLVSSDAVVLVSVDGTPVKVYTDLQTAASDAKAYTAEDKAVLKLLKSVDLGDEDVVLRGGTYTLDLNGLTITSTNIFGGAVYIDGTSELTICNGTIVGDNCCIQFLGNKLTLIDVVLLEASACISVYSGEVIMRRCDIQTFDGIRACDGSVAVYDSTIVSENYDVDWQGGTVTFYGGTEFPGGIETSGVNLEALLGEGMAYWQGDKQMFITADRTEITGGDVTVKAACTHENYTITYTSKDSDSHYTTYSCCGIQYEEAHSLDENGNCTLCGFDPTKTITINMNDSYGDGWTGNAIQIYEDGVLIDTVTIQEGSTATWVGAYNPEKEYEFRWVKGNYPNECSFEILFAGKTVFTATVDDCYGYSDGYRFFPVCEHDYDEGVVTPPTCTDDGYTTYTCSVCGESFNENYVDSVGHVLGEDGNCTNCGSLYCVPVCVAGENITSQNMADILGDGTAYFDPATNTLTLNNYHNGEIKTEIPLNILLLGENTIETEENGIGCDVATGTVNINISGTGSLDILSDEAAVYLIGDAVILTIGGSVTLKLMTGYEGIYMYANDTAALVIQDSAKMIAGTEDAPLEEECIYVYGETAGSVTIADNASFSCATTDEEGIYVGGETASITIRDNATVHVVGDEEGLDAQTITIIGGTVTAIGGENYEGIYADDLTVTGGTVTAAGDGQGIEAENITITGGTVTITGGGMIASTTNDEDQKIPGTITLGQGMAITAPEGATLGELDLTAEEEGLVLAVLNPDGTLADTLTITAGTAPLPGKVLGDLDLDGKVNSDDLTLLARHVGGIELVTGQALENADVNGDGKVNSDDLTKHARYVGGIITDWDQE